MYQVFRKVVRVVRIILLGRICIHFLFTTPHIYVCYVMSAEITCCILLIETNDERYSNLAPRRRQRVYQP